MAWIEFHLSRRSCAGILKFVFWATGLALLPGGAGAQVQVSVMDHGAALGLTNQLEYRLDPTMRWRPTGADSDPAPWQKVADRQGAGNFGSTAAALWFRVNLQADGQAAGDWVWLLRSSQIEHLEVVKLVPDGEPVVVHAGLSEIQAGAEAAHRLPQIPLRLRPGETTSVFMRLQSLGTVKVQVELWRPHALAAREASDQALLGAYFGLLAGLLIYNGFLGLVLKDKAYLYYIAFGCALGVFQLATTGMGPLYAWPRQALHTTGIISLSTCLMAALGLKFTSSFLRMDRTAPRLARFMNWVFLAWLPVMLSHMWLPPGQVINLFTIPLTLLTLGLMASAGGVGLWRRSPGAPYFALAWSGLVLAALVKVPLRLGWLSPHPLLDNAIMIASALEMLLLSLALADRISRERRARGEADTQRLREQAEKEVAQRALLEKSRFMAAVAHDIQQPLYAIGLATEAMARHPASTGLEAPLSQVRSAMHSADELLASLSMAVQLDSAEIRPAIVSHSLQPMLERIDLLFAPMAQQRGLDWRVTPCLARIQSDPALLERMVCNLVANALRYTERGGVMLSCRVRGNGLLLQVWDTGPGIADHEQQTVFDEYFRGSAGQAGDQGLGLGLSIVRRCARLLGIQVGLRSVVGRGSCFHLLVPLSPRPE